MWRPGWSCAVKQPVRPKIQPTDSPSATESAYCRRGTSARRVNHMNASSAPRKPPNDDSPANGFSSTSGFSLMRSGK